MKRLALLLIIILALSAILLVGCGSDETTTTTNNQSQTTSPTGTTATTASSGEGAQNGDTVSVHYRGTLEEDGSQFDSSYDRDEPLTFTVGAGQMISGFDAAVVGMKVGDNKTVTLSPEEAYGLRDDTKIIQFDIEKFGGNIPAIGDQVPLQNNAGQYFFSTVLDITDDYVLLDLNHELAGKTLIFEIEMVNITPAGG